MITRPVNVFDPNYYPLLQIWDAQDQAGKANAKVRLDWPIISENWVRKALGDLSAGKAIGPPPAPPLMIVVADDGTVSRVPFLDLRSPELPAVNSVPNSGGFTFGGAAGSQVAPDRTDQILAMLRAIAAKLNVAGALLVMMAGLSWGQTVNQTNDPPPTAELKLFFYDGSSNLQYICWARQNQMRDTTQKRSDSTLTSIVDSSNTSTITTATAHGLYVGARVTISGATVDTDLNGTYTVATVGSSTTYTITTANVSDATYTESTLVITTYYPLTTLPVWAIQVLTYATTTLTGSFWARASVGYGLACTDRTTY